MTEEKKKEQQALLYQIDVYMQRDEKGENGVCTEVGCTEYAVALREQFEEYSEVEEIFLTDMMDVSQCLAENLGVLETVIMSKQQS